MSSEEPNMLDKEVSDSTDEEGGLKRVVTLGVDVENKNAFKGDHSDGKIEWTWRQLIATCALSAIYVGSQIPLYFVSASLTFIAEELHDTSENSWLPISHTLAIASIAPFCGYLEDIFGRRNISIFGSICIMVGIALVGSTHSFGQAVAGMSIAGVGAAISELTAISGIAELVPVKKRGYYLALNTVVILPFTPVILYVQLLQEHTTWRWGLWICLIWNGGAFLVMLVTYFPKSHPRAQGLSRRAILRDIDYVGAFLSVVGLVLFLVGIGSGGFTHPWKSAYVLCTLLIGAALIIAWILWEWKGAKHPMIPHELFTGQSIIAVTFFIAFVAGINFYSILNFFPLTYSSVYNPAPVQVGLKGLGPSMCIAIGASAVNAMLSVLKGHNKELLLFSTILMTAFGGALATLTPDNPNTAIGLGCIAGFGVGGVLVPTSTIAVTVCPDSLIATTVALSLSIRTIGGSIGFAIYYNIFSNKLKKNLPIDIAQYAVKAGLPKTSAKAFVKSYVLEPTEISHFPGVTPAIIQAAMKGSEWAYADSLKYVWYTSIPFGVLAVIACIFLPSVTKYMTHRIAVSIRQ